jgi:tetratricopeptide (TPR) repeat protein
MLLLLSLACTAETDALVPTPASAPVAVAEPVVVFTAKNGQTITLDELDGDGTVDWKLIGGEDIPDQAVVEHNLGREAGARGDYAVASAHFDKASALAPGWPYPYYDAGFSLLLKGDSTGALVKYERALELSPRGFFTAHVAVDSLRREAKGELPEGTYSAYVALEWVDNPIERNMLLGTMTSTVPQFAPGWHKFALLADDDTVMLERLDAGLEANPDPETLAMLLLNKAALLDRIGRTDEAINILGELIVDPASSLSGEALARKVLAQLVATDPRP